MSIGVAIAAGLLGGVGAVARFLVDTAVSARTGRRFPFGILAVNVSGAFVLGLLAGAALDGDRRLLIAGGLVGSYTTFSTWMFDSDRLREEDRGDLAVVNVVASLVLGLAAVWLGRELGMVL
ncbi:MAG: fluoride exporter [bacterium]|jgi:CrcB protein